MTRSGRAVGTPAFMAPEQALGRVREVDHRTDLWAVGATLFTLVSGRFVHEAETAGELMVFAATRPAPGLRSVAGHVPAGIAKVVDKALRFKSLARWDDATAMAAALERACEASLGRSGTSLAAGATAPRAAANQATHDGMTATMHPSDVPVRRDAPTHTSEVSLPPSPERGGWSGEEKPRAPRRTTWVSRRWRRGR